MKFLGIEINSAEEIGQLRKNYNEVNKAYTEQVIRPNLDTLWLSTETGAKVPIYPFPLPIIYDMAISVDALRIPLETLRREIFRNGLEIKENWKYKCTKCEKEFMAKPTNENDVLECDTCGNTKLLRPEPSHRKTVADFLKTPVNNNGQLFEDVLWQIEGDLDIADMGYMLILKDYDIDPTTRNIVGEKIVEIIRGSPVQINLLADRQGKIGRDDKGRQLYVCPIHRSVKQYTERCPTCDTQCLEAYAETTNIFGAQYSAERIILYGKGEIKWKSKYQPTLLYGYSPIYAVYMKALTLWHMDTYLLKYYDKMRPPRGLLVVSSRNFESMKKAWDAVREKAKEDPYMIYPLMVESDKSGKAIAQWVSFMDSLEDLQFIDVRNELRRTIGAMYGVLPLFSGDLPAGWSNEGMQVTVTNRAVEYSQVVLYKGFLEPLIKDILNIDDWKLQLKANEEADQLRDLQTEQQKIQNAVAMAGMGFSVEVDHRGEFKFSKKPVNMPTGEQGMHAKNPDVKDEDVSNFEGEPKHKRPSDEGGVGTGHPASGTGTSLSNKTEDGWFTAIEKNMLDIENMTSDIQKMVIKDVRADALSSAWIGNYEGAEQLSPLARVYIQQGFALNKTQGDVVRQLNKILQIPEDQARKIVKTEFHVMLNRARELAYKAQDKDGLFRYSWKTGLSPCSACLEIAVKTANGVTMEELKDYIKTISFKYGQKGNRQWHVHPADKCTVVKVKVVKKKNK